MDTETMLRVGAVAVGVLILLSSYVDLSSVTGRLLSLLKGKDTVKPVKPVGVAEDEQFLHIIDLWHQLRAECEDYGLEKAIVAIDKVFPLLNDRIESND
jgi:hypothetical protein